MKALIVFFVLTILFVYKLDAKKIKGTIYYKNDTVDVIIKINIPFFSDEPNYIKLQYCVKYYDSLGVKHKLYPEDAIEIRFTYENEYEGTSEDVRMLSRSNATFANDIFSSRRSLFLKLEVEGKLNLFLYYYKVSNVTTMNANGTMSGGGSYTTSFYLLEKEKGNLKKPDNWSFKKDMAEYFNDCPTLSEKILNKEFRRRDIESIVEFYNSECK